MNKQARAAIPQRAAQAGFTLIELIVVIVILGILAATALPKFSDLSGDARAASLNAAAGALRSASAMAHGQALVDGKTTGSATVTLEGNTINMVNGYPAGDATLQIAAGIAGTDYSITVGPASAAGAKPAVAANEVVFQPLSGAKVSCYVSYKQSAAANTAPVIVFTGSSSDC